MQYSQDFSVTLFDRKYTGQKGNTVGFFNRRIETKAVIIANNNTIIDIEDGAKVEFKGIVVLKDCVLHITGKYPVVIEDSILSGKINIRSASIKNSIVWNSSIKFSKIFCAHIFGGAKQTSIEYSGIRFAEIAISSGKVDASFQLVICDADISSQFDIVYVKFGERAEYAYKSKSKCWTDVFFDNGFWVETTRPEEELLSQDFTCFLNLPDDDDLCRFYNSVYSKTSLALDDFLRANYSYSFFIKKWCITKEKYEKESDNCDKARFNCPQTILWTTYYQKFLLREICDINKVLGYYPFDIKKKKPMVSISISLLDKETAKILGINPNLHKKNNKIIFI